MNSFVLKDSNSFAQTINIMVDFFLKPFYAAIRGIVQFYNYLPRVVVDSHPKPLSQLQLIPNSIQNEDH